MLINEITMKIIHGGWRKWKASQVWGISFLSTTPGKYLPIWRYFTFLRKEKCARSILLKKFTQVTVRSFVLRHFRPPMVDFLICPVHCSILYIFHWWWWTVVTGYGDITYNSRRGILGTISVSGKISYHLYTIDTNPSQMNNSVKLCRKSKWHPEYSTSAGLSELF